MVKGQTTSYYATGGGLNKYQLNAADQENSSVDFIQQPKS